MAGCSSNPGVVSMDTVAVQEDIAETIQTNLEINQEWDGNSVTLSLFDSKGNNCSADMRTVGSECYGFYIGWSANFDDADRVVDYSKAETTTRMVRQRTALSTTQSQSKSKSLAEC